MTLERVVQELMERHTSTDEFDSISALLMDFAPTLSASQQELTNITWECDRCKEYAVLTWVGPVSMFLCKSCQSIFC